MAISAELLRSIQSRQSTIEDYILASKQLLEMDEFGISPVTVLDENALNNAAILNNLDDFLVSSIQIQQMRSRNYSAFQNMSKSEKMQRDISRKLTGLSQEDPSSTIKQSISDLEKAKEIVVGLLRLMLEAMMTNYPK